ncbi:MAG: hypothetical protein GDA43_06360 [Hormoscilla sp. SP5CHS1]|nr:hypothetical protein [Hormoscilla sp. SP12CHS1]MBC6452867.1 hypothetical protein [Hormoscilla sp. SP5CHS1]
MASWASNSGMGDSFPRVPTGWASLETTASYREDDGRSLFGVQLDLTPVPPIPLGSSD